MFTVTWAQPAHDQLARMWMNAASPERREITQYVAELDRNLRANADRIGESREPTVRVLTEVTLGVEFVVANRLVSIKRVWRIRPRAK